MPTKFALEKLDLSMPDGKTIALWFDGNGKITAGNGTFEHPTANAFSLIQVEDCPFATPLCKSVCYVHRLEKAEQEVHEKYRHNSRVIREILGNPDYRETAAEAFAGYIKDKCARGFRWHVSGDIFSLEYSEFIRDVCIRAQPVLNWIYTRSFPYVEPLLAADNLTVNLSTDKDNWDEALSLHRKFGLRLCYLTVAGEIPGELPKGSVIFPSYELRGRDLADPKQAPWWQSLSQNEKRMVCPPDFFGQNNQRRCGERKTGQCDMCLHR